MKRNLIKILSKPKPKISIPKKKLKEIKTDFSELRYKFSEEEIDKYRKGFYNIKNPKSFYSRNKSGRKKSCWVRRKSEI